MQGVSMSPADAPGLFWNRASKKQAPASSLRHNLANHGNLPDLDDVQELLVYLTLLFIVLSWMLREIHIAFFTTGPLLLLNRLCSSATWKGSFDHFSLNYFSLNVRAPSADISCSRSREQFQKPCYATGNAPLSVGGRFALKQALHHKHSVRLHFRARAGMRVSVASVSGEPDRKLKGAPIRVHPLGPYIQRIAQKGFRKSPPPPAPSFILFPSLLPLLFPLSLPQFLLPIHSLFIFMNGLLVGDLDSINLIVDF